MTRLAPIDSGFGPCPDCILKFCGPVQPLKWAWCGLSPFRLRPMGSTSAACPYPHPFKIHEHCLLRLYSGFFVQAQQKVKKWHYLETYSKCNKIWSFNLESCRLNVVDRTMRPNNVGPTFSISSQEYLRFCMRYVHFLPVN